MNIPGHISESLETFFWVKSTNIFDPGSGMDKFGSGSRNTGSNLISLAEVFYARQMFPGSEVLQFNAIPKKTVLMVPPS